MPYSEQVELWGLVGVGQSEVTTSMLRQYLMAVRMQSWQSVRVQKITLRHDLALGQLITLARQVFMAALQYLIMATLLIILRVMVNARIILIR